MLVKRVPWGRELWNDTHFASSAGAKARAEVIRIASSIAATSSGGNQIDSLYTPSLATVI